MVLRLHHSNVCSDDLDKLKWFYGEALGLETAPRPRMTGDPEPGQDESGEWGDTAAFFEAGNPTELQIHATLRRPYASYQYGQSVNPLANGHFCFRTDDLAEVLARLDKHGVPYSDYDYWAIQGWHQVFLSDPAGNIIEIHQVDDLESLEEFEPEGLLRLHHVNVCSDDLDKLRWFYREALGLDPAPRPAMTGDPEAGQDDSGEWGDTAAFFEAGIPAELQIHATLRRPYASYEYGQSVNPLANGHFCFRTDDLEQVLARLDKNNVPYSDYGYWAIKGWHQVFLSDPAGNIIEIHQVDKR